MLNLKKEFRLRSVSEWRRLEWTIIQCIDFSKEHKILTGGAPDLLVTFEQLDELLIKVREHREHLMK